ncbi:hypothetical protein L6255_00085 [Candidatus Parcubacteria bacterium]|nr:hypothetical protein [Patescibacteria group bacterium]MCG2688840.1 hypothetical protein [Candidatus Parcubacteria bacterium]
MQPTTINVFLGPQIGDSMAFVYLNLVAFLVTLMFVLRVGTGKIAKPIFFISLGFLISACIPLTLGNEYLWMVPLIQTLFSILGIMGFMSAYGVFDLITKKQN